ncbi:hypothetical protein PHYPO_G00075040 [Pangasianodon hypophthalmus]|uniref:UPAR/Ly6 domain-containing protein n=1 Tax=Pangasianodon hypophthalmus TaxID=310915 RepID=A0A5N5LVF2_PANHP|nr:urokinase plasminogen activator surface receptor [Pangasianodon hypophthalmus]KAB5546702.1 hypothetical protein PHYPO_G00075040 [Pangasianodon hypophthalmus]
MKFQLTLLLISMLFSEALSLVCQCVSPLGSVRCQSTEINCPSQCASVTLFTVKDGKNLTTALKTCGVPELCSTESVNLGEVKVTRNVKCCNTTRCNTETLPVLPEQRANGKMCYSCKDNDCSQTVDCVGNELHCISQKVTDQGKTLTMKGCAVKSACDNSALLNLQGIDSLNIQCCEGNLCNGVESFTLSFLLMFLSLLSSILFY